MTSARLRTGNLQTLVTTGVGHCNTWLNTQPGVLGRHLRCILDAPCSHHAWVFSVWVVVTVLDIWSNTQQLYGTPVLHKCRYGYINL
jgi:hypothetical protein